MGTEVGVNKLLGFTGVVVTAILMVAPSGGAAVAANPPLGFTVLCIKQPAECRGGGDSQVTASTDVMATLQRVNNRVNRSISPREDGAVDVWTVGASSGDCEDYVLAKRHQLINAGVPASSLRIAYVKTRHGAEHAILVVNTSRGKLVLDNLTSSIKPLSQTGYRIISMQTANPKKWV
jgi:predicted transglutaminase-like cysteine proteinase